MNPRLIVLVSCTVSLSACRTHAESAPPGRRQEVGPMRPATHAGSWYPAEPEALRRKIQARLARHRPPADAPPIVALVGPHAGLRYSGEVAAAGYRELQGQPLRRAFLIGPSHHLGFDGLALPADELGGYATPLGELRIDREAVAALRGQPGFGGPSRAHEPEHSLEMHAIFLAAVHPQATIVPLVAGDLGDEAELAAVAARLRDVMRPDDVVLVSSDFTHFGAGFRYQPFTRDVAQGLTDLLDQASSALGRRSLADFDAHLAATHDTICGREPLRLLLALLPGDSAAREVARDTSGRMTGDYSTSVSYLSLAYRRTGGWGSTAAATAPSFAQGPQVLDAAGQQLALRIVRTTLARYLERGETPSDDELGVPAAGPLRDTASVFVTLKKRGELRGCIGHIRPTQALWRDIRDNAISAAVHDPRFPAVTAAELAELQVEVSVLTPPRRVAGAEEFVVGRHGVIIGLRGRSAVFLPQVAPEQGWDRETTLDHLARKAGLSPDAWRDPATVFEVFEAQVFGEAEH